MDRFVIDIQLLIRISDKRLSATWRVIWKMNLNYWNLFGILLVIYKASLNL